MMISRIVNACQRPPRAPARSTYVGGRKTTDSEVVVEFKILASTGKRHFLALGHSLGSPRSTSFCLVLVSTKYGGLISAEVAGPRLQD